MKKPQASASVKVVQPPSSMLTGMTCSCGGSINMLSQEMLSRQWHIGVECLKCHCTESVDFRDWEFFSKEQWRQKITTLVTALCIRADRKRGVQVYSELGRYHKTDTLVVECPHCHKEFDAREVSVRKVLEAEEKPTANEDYKAITEQGLKALLGV